MNGGLAPPAVSITCICAGAFFLVINDAIGKSLCPTTPVVEILFFRMLVSLPLLMAAGLWFGGRHSLVTHSGWLQLGRGFAATVAPITYIFGLGLIPMAKNAAIGYTAPLFITLLAIPLLKEHPDWKQWLATLAGFGGVLWVVKPGTDFFAWNSALPLASAVAYALVMISARTLAVRGDSIWVTMTYSTLVPLVVSGVLLPLDWVTPRLDQWLELMASGVVGGLAITLITQAFRVGHASTVAPFDYSGLLWSALLGWMFWGEVPHRSTVGGLIIILLAGVYLARHQGSRLKSRPRVN